MDKFEKFVAITIIAVIVLAIVLPQPIEIDRYTTNGTVSNIDSRFYLNHLIDFNTTTYYTIRLDNGTTIVLENVCPHPNINDHVSLTFIQFEGQLIHWKNWDYIPNGICL